MPPSRTAVFDLSSLSASWFSFQTRARAAAQNIDDLLAFVAVASDRSFTQAAALALPFRQIADLLRRQKTWIEATQQ